LLRGGTRSAESGHDEQAKPLMGLGPVLSSLPIWLRRLRQRGRASELSLAVAVALIWWLAVQTDVRPLVEQVVPPPGAEARLPLQFVVADADVAAYRRDDVAVQLRLRGFRSALAEVEPAALVALVEVPATAAGEQQLELPVSGRCRRRWTCWRKGLRVVGSEPATLALGLGGVVTVDRPVTVDAAAAMAPRTQIERRATFPQTVRVSGAAAQVSRVSVLRATLPEQALVPGLRRVEAVPVLPMDAFGRPIHDLQILPSTVAVELLVAERGEPVAVSPRWRIAPAEGYEIYDVDVDPESIQLEGEVAVVEQVRQRGFRPFVDLTDLREDTIKRFALDLPGGVRALDGVEAITVSLKVRPQTGTRSLTLTMRPINLPEGLVVEPAAETLQAVLEGPRPLLDGLDPAELSAELDLRGLTAGTHRIEPVLVLPGGVSARRLAPEAVEVTLRLASDAGAP